MQLNSWVGSLAHVIHARAACFASFEQAGTFTVHSSIHGSSAAKDMHGKEAIESTGRRAG
jgi:hypothetical protein